MIARMQKSSKLQRLLCNSEYVSEKLEGKRVAIVGSGPGSLTNKIGFVDSHDVVMRVNNYKIFPQTGLRTDIHYSFYGQSIRKTRRQLIGDGVKLCMCKCPNAKFMESRWHRENGKHRGTDFRYIYDGRRDWWFCKTYVPSLEEFMEQFNLLDRHVPTTGFSAILDVLKYNPASVYITGFDFFQSGTHNVNEPWRMNNPDDPIGHVPDKELAWLVSNIEKYPITVDPQLQAAMNRHVKHEERKKELYPINLIGNKRILNGH
jgi:hypothetical protein